MEESLGLFVCLMKTIVQLEDDEPIPPPVFTSSRHRVIASVLQFDFLSPEEKIFVMLQNMKKFRFTVQSVFIFT